MRLVYLHQYFTFPNGPGGTRSYDLATSFMKMGIIVEVVTSSSFITNSGEFRKGWNILEKDGLKLHILKLNYSNDLSYFKRAIVFFQFLWFASFKLLSLKPELVLATSTPLTIGIPALIKKWVHKTPFIFEVRDVWPEAVIAIGAIKSEILQTALYWLEKITYKNAAAIVPLSIDMMASIINRFPNIKGKPIEVIENISEINRFQNGYNKESSFLLKTIGFKPRFSILYAGTFGRVNGISYVINLAEKVIKIDSTIVFILIGSGAEKDIIIQLARDYKVLNKNLFILEVVPKKMLPQIYYETNMGSSFVAPIKELWANSANKFFDTLAAGKPVLTNYEGWQAGVIQNKNVGYVLPSKIESEKQIKNFVEYTHDINLILKQGRYALEVAKEKYSLEVAVKKYLSLFSQFRF